MAAFLFAVVACAVPLYSLLVGHVWVQMRRLKRCEPWLEGFRVSLGCFARAGCMHAMHEEVIVVHECACRASNLTSFLL
jgi:hypothetical protein